ncbi:unnamed protein product [Brassica oleracea]|uniref:(rape) hypothetical protein n=1 Tax=Brassica napus TaxID=3708 RepID=A0A816I475_BRANA|nr:unnamed protein product [Brassica napus]
MAIEMSFETTKGPKRRQDSLWFDGQDYGVNMPLGAARRLRLGSYMSCIPVDKTGVTTYVVAFERRGNNK